jgi:hypothetical protein
MVPAICAWNRPMMRRFQPVLSNSTCAAKRRAASVPTATTTSTTSRASRWGRPLKACHLSTRTLRGCHLATPPLRGCHLVTPSLRDCHLASRPLRAFHLCDPHTYGCPKLNRPRHVLQHIRQSSFPEFKCRPPDVYCVVWRAALGGRALVRPGH